jgi:tetratricopeptide (TPR) repeat protein
MGAIKTSPFLRRGLVLFIFLGVFLLNPAARAETITLPAIDLARALIVSKHFDAARSILTILHENDPADIEALFLLAEADAQTGNLEGAVERYREILVNEPNVARVRLDLAAALFLLGEDEAAQYHFRQALTLEPSISASPWRPTATSTPGPRRAKSKSSVIPRGRRTTPASSPESAQR